MLNVAEIDVFRQALLRELADIGRDQAATAEDRGTVELDRQSVGRLSRMDAMQRQAMAQATSRRRAGRQSKIEAALRRMDEDEFGYCQECGEDIGTPRLTLDPASPTCVSCAKGASGTRQG